MESLKDMSVQDIVSVCRPRRRVENSVSKKRKKECLKELTDRGKTGEVKPEILREILMDLLPPAPQGRKELEKLQVDLAEITVSEKMVAMFKENKLKQWESLDDEALLYSFRNSVLEINTTGNIELSRQLAYEIFRRGIPKAASEWYFSYIKAQIPKTTSPLFYEIVEQMLKKIIA